MGRMPFDGSCHAHCAKPNEVLAAVTDTQDVGTFWTDTFDAMTYAVNTFRMYSDSYLKQLRNACGVFGLPAAAFDDMRTGTYAQGYHDEYVRYVRDVPTQMYLHRKRGTGGRKNSNA